MRAFLQHPLALLMALALAAAMVVVAPVTEQTWLPAAQAQETNDESAEGGAGEVSEVEASVSDGGLTLTVDPITPATVPAGGGDARLVYTVKNTTEDDVFRLDTTANDICGSNVSSSGLEHTKYLYPGQTVTFACSAWVTWSKPANVSVTFTKLDDQIENPTTVTLEETETRVVVEDNTDDGQVEPKCNRQYFSTFYNGSYQFDRYRNLVADNPYNPPNVIGYIDPFANDKDDGTNAIPANETWRIPPVTDRSGARAYETGAAALAVDPRNPDVAYAALRTKGFANNYRGILARFDLSEGKASIIGWADAFKTDRLAMDGDGTLWSLSRSGHLWALPNVDQIDGETSYANSVLEVPLAESTAPFKVAGTQNEVGLNELEAINYGLFAAAVRKPDGTKEDDEKAQYKTAQDFSSGDIAFDGNGNLWAILASGYDPNKQETESSLVTVSKAELAEPQEEILSRYVGETRNNMGSATGGLGSYYNGLSFGENAYGTSLLFGTTVDDANNNRASTFYSLSENDGSTTNLGDTQNLTFGDLASCAQPQGDLAIEKAVKLLKSEDGVSELEYTVTVRNTGNVTATAVTFHDELDAETVLYVEGSTTLNGHKVPDVEGVFPYQGVRYINGASVEGNETAGNYELSRGVIPPKDQATVTFRVTAKGQKKVCNQGRVASLSEQDGILSDDPSVMGREPTVDPTCIELSDPNINIDKIGHPDPIDLTESQRHGEEAFELPYTIRVTNDGDVAGESPPIRDLPANYEGFKIVGLEYGQLTTRGEPKTNEKGERLYASASNFGTAEEPEFRIPSGVIVNGKTIDIPIRLIVSAEDVAEDFDWTQFGECREDGASDGSSTGFINTVVKPSSLGSEESRDTACDEVRVPQFAVKKEADGDAPKLTLDTGKGAFAFTRAYKVTVTNIGEVKATSSQVFDTPILGEGTEVTELKVDGDVVAPGEDGRYLISEGVELEAGGTKEFTVVLSGTMTAQAAAELPADNTGVCEALDPSKPTAVQGIVNTVSMRGDSDDEGDENNIVCDPVPKQDPKFVVDKQAQEGDVVVTWDEEQGKFTFKREYSITVKNNGVAPGNSGVVYDQPALREGLEITSFTLDGGETLTADEQGRYLLSEGVDLNPGGDQVFKVSITGTATRDVVEDLPATEDQCKAAKDDPNAATGLVNVATLGDGTGEGEKDIECNPVKNPETQFAVEKESAGEEPVELEWDKDANAYAFTRSYNVTVTNLGDVKGTSAVIYDEPETGAGVTITEVKVDGEAVEADEVTGGYLVSEGVELNSKQTKSFEVTISGTMSPERVEQVIANEAEQCVVTAPGASAFGQGLVNVVRMDGDSDEEGESNNIACDPVTPPTPGIDITKLVNDQDADIAANAPVVAPGEDMTITYRVKNTGTMLLRDVKITDVVTQAQNDEAKGALQQAIDTELAKLKAVDIAPGTVAEFTITVPAIAGGHENEARPTVPPVTVPGTTRPGTTVPGTKNETTTVPGTTDPGTTVPGTEITVTTPSDPGRANDPQVEIVKKINGQDANLAADAPIVAPGEDMEITYTVTNTGNVALKGVHVVDEVTEGAAKDELQQAIDAELEKLDAVDLEPGESKDFTVTVKATKGGHVNVARPTVPPVTVPGTTRPGTTVPGTTDPSTTVPGTTDPGTTVPGTEVTVTTPSDPGRVNDPRIEIKKTINGQDANHAADAPVIAPGEDMTITYTLTNTGNVDFKGVHVLDQVTEGAAKDELQQAINAELAKLKAVDLAAGTAAEFTVTVKATKGGHENEARPTVPPVTVPGTTRPGTTVPGTTNETTTVPGTTDPGTTVPGTEITVTTPSDPGRANDPQVAITKLINGEDANEPESAVTVAAGAPMTISYVVSNPGNVDLKGVNVVDEVEGGDNADLQKAIDAALKDVEPFDLAAGESTTVTVEVDAPEGAHKNVARPTVPPVTIPGTTVSDTTVPGTTVPGTTNETTTDPGTTKPDTTVPGTTVPSTVVTVTTPTDPAHSTPEPKAGLEVKKYINGRDDNALVTAGEDMEITYRVTNTGETTLDGIRLLDEVKEDNADLQQQIDAQLGKQPSFGLAPGESRDVTVTVKAPVGRHDNAVRVTVPPVTVPGTTVPDTTVPGTTNATTTNPGTTVPGTTNPGTTVTLTSTPSDDASSDSPQLAILKEIKAADEDEDAWRDAEDAADALPVKPGADMQLRYTVTNTGSVALSGIDVVDSVTRLDDGDADAFTAVINDALAAEGRGFDLQPGESKAIVITVAAPEGYHVNEAVATAPPVTATETVVTSIPGTTDATTTVPGTVTTETTVVERVPNTPVDRAQSTPTVDPTPCDCTVETTTLTPPPVTVTRTTPVTTVQTITPEPTTVVTTVTGPTATTTPRVPGQVVVVVDEDDKAVTTVSPTPTDGYVPEVTHTATYTLPPVTTVTVTDTPVTSTTKTSVINKCVANAVRSPLLYMVPLALAGQLLGDAAAPYVAQINDRFNQISNEIQEEIRRNTPDLGFGRRGHENEQVAQLRARLDEANRQLGQLMNRPEVREYGKWAAVALGVVVAGSVLYDWCTNEEGEAFTAIGPKKTTTIDDVRVGGSSLLGRGDAATSVAPVTQTTEGETTDGDVEADAGSADSSSTGLLDGSSDGSSEGSSDGSSEGSSGSSK